MSFIFTGELCAMAMKNDAKNEEELTDISKLTWGIWRILIRALENIKNMHFEWILLGNVFNVWAKKI